MLIRLHQYTVTSHGMMYLYFKVLYTADTAELQKMTVLAGTETTPMTTIWACACGKDSSLDCSIFKINVNICQSGY